MKHKSIKWISCLHVTVQKCDVKVKHSCTTCIERSTSHLCIRQTCAAFKDHMRSVHSFPGNRTRDLDVTSVWSTVWAAGWCLVKVFNKDSYVPQRGISDHKYTVGECLNKLYAIDHSHDWTKVFKWRWRQQTMSLMWWMYLQWNAACFWGSFINVYEMIGVAWRVRYSPVSKRHQCHKHLRRACRCTWTASRSRCLRVLCFWTRLPS